MDREDLKEHFTLQLRLRELCDEAGISRPLSKREMAIGVLALAAVPPGKDNDAPFLDLSRAL
jgi:hypothetical protein